LEELKEKPEEDPKVISFILCATINLGNMTVTMFNNPKVALKLIRSDNYQDHVRPKYNSKADASSMNIRGKWPEYSGEFA